MSARLVLIAVAVVAGASAAFAADPAAKPAEQVVDAQAATPRLLLASADQARQQQPASEQAATTTKRPRVARVTSCRCGGQTPQDESGDR